MEKIQIQNEGQRMDGTLFLAESVEVVPGVIFFHGLTSSEKRYLDMAERLSKQDISALTINMRGHGSSEGTLDSLQLTDNISDALAVYDFFASHSNIDATRIGICGSSYGSLLAAIVADQRPIKSLLLRAPAAYSSTMANTTFSELLQDERGIFKNLDLDTLHGLTEIRSFSGSLFVVASEHDDIIPLSITQAYFDNATQAETKEFEVMIGAPHSLSSTPDLAELFTQKALRWFAEAL